MLLKQHRDLSKIKEKEKFYFLNDQFYIILYSANGQIIYDIHYNDHTKLLILVNKKEINNLLHFPEFFFTCYENDDKFYPLFNNKSEFLSLYLALENLLNNKKTFLKLKMLYYNEKK